MSNIANQYHIVVIDDDELIHDSLKLCLPEGWEMTSSMVPQIPEGKTLYHAAFVDMHLTGRLDKVEGLTVIAELHRRFPNMEIVAMSGDMNQEIMEQSLKLGASRFLAKPLSVPEVAVVLEKIETIWQLKSPVSRRGESQLKWIGESEPSEKVKKFIAYMAGESSPILIEGESGTGKEVVAQLLGGSGSARPFVSVNMAAIPENLFESLFFGHSRGAFTGAVNAQVGLAEQAHGGDLFLDEVEALPMVHQAKLLRFLETGEFRKVGGKENQLAQVRIISATNVKLEDLVARGEFREDLLFRLSGHKLVIPPLRSRGDDVPILAKFFLNQQKNYQGKTFSEGALKVLSGYEWPGNVRELKRVIEQVCVLAPLPIIREEDLIPLLRPTGGVGTQEVLSMRLEDGLSEILSQYEKEILIRAIQQYEEIENIISVLKISRSSFYKKVKDHNLEFKK